MAESNRIEYKASLSDALEKEVVAFLNTPEGGLIYFGIADDGSVSGLLDLDSIQLKIKDRLRHNILPSCLGLFDLVVEKQDDQDILKLIIASGPDKPYYIRKQGMSERGCYLRIGSASEPMPTSMIESLFSRRVRNRIGNMRSPRTDLHFEQLKIYYQESDLSLNNDTFPANLELLTEDGSYNYAAYLLADANGNSVKVAKYADTDRVDLIESDEFGNCCLVKAAKQVIDKLNLENRTATLITHKERLEQKLYEPRALREAVINAIIHNDYTNGVPPKFELFSDRLEITSAGSLPEGLSQSEFFAGYSVPRNQEMMRVFRDLDMVEQLGSGIPRILATYSKDAFTFTEHFTRLTYIYSIGTTPSIPPSIPPSIDLTKRQKEVLALISDNPKISYRKLAESLAINESTAKEHLEALKTKGAITRIGGTRGHWQVKSQEGGQDEG